MFLIFILYFVRTDFNVIFLMEAMLRNWKRFGLRHAERTPLYMAWVLSLISPARWEEALGIIQVEIDQLAVAFLNALRFGHYIRTQ